MAALPAEVSQAMTELEAALAAVEAHADGLLSLPLGDLRERLSPLDQAKTHVLLAYAINTLFYIYLKTQGVSPANHPVKAELDRVRLYVKKIKVLTGERATPGAEAANRFVLNNLDRDTREAAKEKEKEKEREREKGKERDTSAMDDEGQRKRRQDKSAGGAPEGKRPR